MDTILASPQGGPAQPIPPQENPIVQPIKKNKLRKFLDIGSWVIFFTLLPITVLIFLSQDSIPGDFFYPAKRGMENMILAAASVSPATRAAFRTDLTETRFKEAKSLVVSQSNTSGLSTFADDVEFAQIEVASLKNDNERQKAEEKLSIKIDEYQSGLSTLEAKTEQTIITYQLQDVPTMTPIPPTSAPNLPSATPTFTPTPTAIPTSTPTPTSVPAPSQIPPTAILTPSPTLAPTVVPQPENTQITEQRKIVESIKDTKEKLEKIKKELEERKKERQDASTRQKGTSENTH